MDNNVKTEEVDAKEETSKSSGELVCCVCGDVATGRHYGAIACNGCKGFYRRTIRRQYKYTCRFENNCNLNKHNRAICRACRYMRCVKAGMKEEQVQNERDIIGKRVRTNSGASTNYNGRTSSGSLKRHQSCEDGQVSKRSSPEMATDDPWGDHESLIEALLLSENTIQNLRDTVIKQTGSVEYSTQPEQSGENKGRIASINDIFKSLHSQLLLVIEWAKTLPPFTKLSTEDQTILLKNFATQHIVLCVSYRSKDAPDFLKLINDSLIPRASSLMDEKQTGLYYLKDCEKVMDEMVAPMRYLKMDDSEFVAIKACVLFNPVAKGLSPESVDYTMKTRRRIFAALQHYVQTNKPEDNTRIGDLLLFTLGPLSSLANSFSEDVMVTNLIGAARIDQLMAELILADSEDPRCRQKRDLLVCNDALNQQPHSVASPGFPCFSPSPHNPPVDFQLQSADNSLHPILPPSTESLPLTTDDAPFDGCNAFGTYNIFESSSCTNSPTITSSNPMWSSSALSNDPSSIYSNCL